MMKEKTMCVISFEQTCKNEGFDELMGVVQEGREITYMGNDQYVIERTVCENLVTPHHILEEIK